MLFALLTCGRCPQLENWENAHRAGSMGRNVCTRVHLTLGQRREHGVEWAHTCSSDFGAEQGAWGGMGTCGHLTLGQGSGI